MRSPTMWIGIFCGGFVTAILMAYRVKGAIIAGILLVAITSWPRNSSVTYFPHNDPTGDANFDFFKKVVTFHGIQETLVAQDWNVAGVTGQFGLAFITFLYVDILDCTGTLYSMARFSGAIDEETQDFEGSAVAYLVDGEIFLPPFASIILIFFTQLSAFPSAHFSGCHRLQHSLSPALEFLRVAKLVSLLWLQAFASLFRSSSRLFLPPFHRGLQDPL